MITTCTETPEGTVVPWWLVLLEGVAAVIIGLFLLTAPGTTLFFLVQVTGFFWFIGGIFRIVSLFVDNSLWGWKLLAGALGILAGLLILDHPLWSTVLIPAIYVIILGIQGMFSGVFSLVLAFRGGGWGIGILGILSIVLGIVLLLNPLFVGLAVLPFVLGTIGLVGGILAIVVAFTMRRGSRAQAGEARPA